MSAPEPTSNPSPPWPASRITDAYEPVVFAPPDPRELRIRWVMTSAFEGSPSAAERLAKGWEPFAVTGGDRGDQLPRIWFRRQEVGG